jgi:DNA-binding IclR family transcriptional regulator
MDPSRAVGKSMNKNSKRIFGVKDNYEYIVPAVDRAARILMLLRTQGRDMTIAEITEETGWHKSSVHKLLVTLSHHGLLDRDEETKRYSLGIGLIGYGQFVFNNLDSANATRSLLKQLADFSGETANYCLVQGGKVIVVDSVESRIDLRVVPPVGTVNSLTMKSNGKAVLAFLPESQAKKIIQEEELQAFTKKSITDPEAFYRELSLVRKRGYATDFEEFREGISAISVPVFNSTGKVIGTLSLIAPASRMTADKASSYGKKCMEAAAHLSSVVSYQDPAKR